MPLPAHSFSRRVLSRLIAAETQESDPWLRDDLRIARLTVAHAAHGDAVLCSPQVLASYEVLGLHPEKVWPAIQARRKALLGPPCVEVSGLPPVPLFVPKKPAQSVKLWGEKTNGARAINSHAGDMVLCEPRILPMATASIAALYRNPEASSSAKPRGFTYEQILAAVKFSGAPHSVRQGTLNALSARGRWPNEDGAATGIICVSLEGMMYGNEDGAGNVVRSTARWRARQAVRHGFWRKLRNANSWSNCRKCGAERSTGKCEHCGYVGRSKTPEGKANFDEFCRPYMYEIDVEKFLAAPRAKGIGQFEARTYTERKEAAKRDEHQNVTEMPSRKPAQPAPPPKSPAPVAPLPKQPAAEHEHRSTQSIGRDARQALFNAYIALKRSGMTHEKALGEVVSQFKNKFSPDDVEFALKIMGHKNGRDVTSESEAMPPKQIRCFTCMDNHEVWNRGPGPRKLPCPDCSLNSS